MTLPLLASAAFAAPALVPQSGALTTVDLIGQWVVCAILAAGVAGWRKLDDFGSNETALRAMEARDWLDQMNERRVW